MASPYQRVNRPIRHILHRIWKSFEARRMYVLSAYVYLHAPTLRSHSKYTTCGLRFKEEDMKFARSAPEGRSLRRVLDENTYIRFTTGGHAYICVATLDVLLTTVVELLHTVSSIVYI